jgi:hypothetical protein
VKRGQNRKVVDMTEAGNLSSKNKRSPLQTFQEAIQQYQSRRQVRDNALGMQKPINFLPSVESKKEGAHNFEIAQYQGLTRINNAIGAQENQGYRNIAMNDVEDSNRALGRYTTNANDVIYSHTFDPKRESIMQS